jgi:hypothetical protein
MPSPKSGNAGSAVPPAAPTAPFDADDADPGAVDQVKATQSQTQAGKYDAAQVKPFKPPQTKQEKAQKRSWIEIVMVDKKNKPVPGVPYSCLLPDGETVATGTLDEKGFARVEGFEAGTCKISFPTLDKDIWETC